MVLHLGDEDFIPCFNSRPHETVGQQVKPFGGAAYKNDLFRLGSPQKRLHLAPRALVKFGCHLAQPVHTAVDVGVLVAVQTAHRIDDDLRFLGTGRAVQKDQIVLGAGLAQQRKIIEGATLTHKIQAPVSGDGLDRIHQLCSSIRPSSTTSRVRVTMADNSARNSGTGTDSITSLAKAQAR